MKEVCTIYMVRHGESHTNREGIVGGHLGTPLTETGRLQVLQTKEALKAIHFDSAYSSDLERAVETGEIIFGKPIAKSHRLQELRERNFASLDGQPESELISLRVEHHNRYRKLSPEERWQYTYGTDMESNHALSSRVIKALKRIGNSNPGKSILVACHGGCIRTALIRLGYATEDELPPRSFRNAGYVELTYDGKIFSIVNVVGANKQSLSAGQR